MYKINGGESYIYICCLHCPIFGHQSMQTTTFRLNRVSTQWSWISPNAMYSSNTTTARTHSISHARRSLFPKQSSNIAEPPCAPNSLLNAASDCSYPRNRELYGNAINLCRNCFKALSNITETRRLSCREQCPRIYLLRNIRDQINHLCKAFAQLKKSSGQKVIAVALVNHPI